MIDTRTAYSIASAAVLLLTGVPTIVIFLCSLCLARRHRDPARSWLVLYKAAFGCFVLSITLIFLNYLFAVVYFQLYDPSVAEGEGSVISNVLSAEAETNIVGSLFDAFALIFVLVALLRLAAAANLVHAGKDSLVDRIMLFGGYGFAALLSILNIVAFGLSERQYAITYGTNGGAMSSAAWNLLRSTNNVTFAMFVIRLVFNVAVLVQSILVAVKTRSEPRVTTATRYLLVCCTLLLVKTVYTVTYYAIYIPLGDPESEATEQLADYIPFLDTLLNFWPMFITFVILFALGAKKQYGVWATEQPFMMVRPGGEGMPLQQAGYFDSQELQAPQFRHELSAQFRPELQAQQHWQQVPSQHHQQPYEMSVQTGSTSSPPPPPPSHFETVGLNHQADGTPPQTSTLPYNEKP